MAMLGSGPFSNSSGSGYYTVYDYQRILRRAVERHVEIIPEFDMPSHSHAAIKSMERRYQRLSSHMDGVFSCTRQCDNYNLKSQRRCNNMSCMNFSVYIGHVTIFGRMFTIACCLVVGLGLDLASCWQVVLYP